MQDLFDFSKNRTPSHIPAPLARRLSPQRLEDFVGQRQLFSPGCPLRRAVETGDLDSAVFFGPPGSGKSALARLIIQGTRAQAQYLNAVGIGVAEIRKIIQAAQLRRTAQARGTLLIIDEIHHFNRSQQDILLPSVEEGVLQFIGITTENPHFYLNAALLSRLTIYEFLPLEQEDLEKILERALAQKIKLHPQARAHLLRYADGDARRLLNALEIALQTAAPGPDAKTIELKAMEEACQKRSVRYDKTSDEHYDHISAFIKSMRGSDPDAAVYWMAKMLEAGEDPRFIARRILICASEDVGNADPQALGVAAAAFQAVELVGMPEARIPLAQAALYVACAPKSNASYLAVEGAIQEVRSGPRREVPRHLRDANLDAKSRRHGEGYLYPHDFPGHFVSQEYLPDPRPFYHPTDEGFEKTLQERLARRRALRARPISGAP
ncbi:MAG: replication-associated recombination protein A [Elusimicrobia bacterium]|nr:replication-associated recombination protein A [Elusimicrobiota bacterium]